MMALVTMPYSVGLTMTCGVRVSRVPLKAGCTSQRLESPMDTFWISSPASSSTSQTLRGSHVTMASVSPYGYWMNSLVRMIGADWPAFQARIAAWTSGSSGGTSSAVAVAGWGSDFSGSGVARTRSSSSGAGWVTWVAQPASEARAAHTAARG